MASRRTLRKGHAVPGRLAGCRGTAVARQPLRAGLENRGLLAADWKATETGREAKFYRLTRKGRQQLETESASWQPAIAFGSRTVFARRF